MEKYIVYLWVEDPTKSVKPHKKPFVVIEGLNEVCVQGNDSPEFAIAQLIADMTDWSVTMKVDAHYEEDDDEDYVTTVKKAVISPRSNK